MGSVRSGIAGWFRKLLAEPPPSWIFEIGATALHFAHHNGSWRLGSVPIEPGVLRVNPVEDNVQDPDRLLALVQGIAPDRPRARPRPAALILPDYSARVMVLEFDEWPRKPQDRESLIRFRLRKSIPFDLDLAQLSYVVQERRPAGAVEVVVAVAARAIVGPYEAAFRQAGFHPGHVTTSMLCAVNLVPSSGCHVLAKLDGTILSLAVLHDGHLRLVRALELAELSAAEIMPILFATFASIEDQLGQAPERLYLWGFGELAGPVGDEAQASAAVAIGRVETPWGEPTGCNAGLMGYVHALEGGRL